MRLQTLLQHRKIGLKLRHWGKQNNQKFEMNGEIKDLIAALPHISNSCLVFVALKE